MVEAKPAAGPRSSDISECDRDCKGGGLRSWAPIDQDVSATLGEDKLEG